MATTRQPRKWTAEEDERLLRQIKSFPQNLSRCFIIVAEEIGRTPQAVQSHWYTVLSKKPGVLALGTITPTYFSRNRKNGMGVEIPRTIWQRFCHLVRHLLD